MKTKEENLQITVYSKERCVQCTATIRNLSRLEVYHTIEHADNLPKDVAALGYLQAPIVTVRNEDGAITDSWYGYNPGKIEEYAAVAV